MSRSLILALLFTMLASLSLRAETYLLMAEEQGCYWCARWNEEISHIYPKTDEGHTAPLRRYDLHRDTLAEVTFVRPVLFTPTFLLIEDGTEVARIEGYPGEDFFWGLLTGMFQRAGIEIKQAGS